MLVNPKEMLLAAQKNGSAVGAFNAENAEMVFAIVFAAQSLGTGVIVQTTPSTLRYLPPEAFAGIVRAAANLVAVPVALHLDHGDSLELVERCIRAGYTSVMFDGSRLCYEENIAQTKAAAELADSEGVFCEGELGAVGGKEDDLLSENASYTDPLQAADFVCKTKIGSLAPAIGTAHGLYKSAPVLDFPRLQTIREKVAVPLVLHGSTGLSDQDIKTAISHGTAKINFATGLRIAFSDGAKEYLARFPQEYDPKKFLGAARESATDWVSEKIKLCSGKLSL